ncbi:hypothetical protein BT93_F1666 [Corymbia citriodora subsp. variegata]|nr:hypothetical protein BT93_F1666 [Corymbia citriodora subsp. variegata]
MRNSSFLLVLALSLLHISSQTSSANRFALQRGSSLSIDNPDEVPISNSGVFSVWFYPIGENAYCFAVWFSRPPCSGRSCTVVWMVNRDKPVNGRRSKLSLKKNGNLMLTDAGHTILWAQNTVSLSLLPVHQLQLLDSGNLVLRDRENKVTVWQSFDSRDTPLVSSRSKGNFSSGYYKLYFNNDNVLRLLFDGPSFSSVYLLDPSKASWEVGRTTYNDSRVAMLGSLGNFTSSDNLKFLSSDFSVKTQRILKVNNDGGEWVVTWQAISEPCTVHGICGPNGICSYSPGQGRSCACAPGYVWKHKTDWIQGCVPKFMSFCDKNSETQEMCENLCNCRCFQYKFKDTGSFDSVVEAVVIFLTWSFLTGADRNKGGAYVKGFHPAATGCRRFTYAKPKKATENFHKEIGRGSRGIVTIGNPNHMNLIELWGYCAEGKYGFLVYEFMDHGSLSENLSSPQLDWTKRFEIAVGSANGLAYLHEECLKWDLHCDVEPQNILLDSKYHAKVADFGLSKLLNRKGPKNTGFSRVRGTRGYMAPEWAGHLPITSKVDVYGYGIFLLEMLTGRNPIGGHAIYGEAKGGYERSTSWVREKMKPGVAMETWTAENIDPTIRGNFDIKKIKVLVSVALQCEEEDRDSRPTMRQVVEMLLRHENGAM